MTVRACETCRYRRGVCPPGCNDQGHHSWEPCEDAPEIEPKPEVDSKIAAASKKSEPFRRALTAVHQVSMYGEGKHGPNNWQSARADGMHYYEDALWRHLQLRRLGFVRDGDELPEARRNEGSRLPHLAHMAWSALMLLEMELRGVTSDEWEDPPDPPGPFAHWLPL